MAPAGARGMLSWAFYDWANSAFATLIQTFVFAAYFTRSVAASPAAGTALWGNTIGAAGLVIALAGPVLGAVADHGGRRKPWLAAFTLLAVVSTALLWFVRPAPAWVVPALALVGLGTIGTECASIFYNAMLPALAPPERIGRWSGWGWALGYAGGLACLVVALLVFIRPAHPPFGLTHADAAPVRATFVLTAVWFALFALPLLLFTPDGPATGKPLRRAVPDGLRQLRGTLRRVRAYRDLARFLVARLLFIDALATIFAFGGVYAAGHFDMNEQQVLLFGIALNVSAGAGAWAFAWVDDHLGSKLTIVLALLGLLVTTALALAARSAAVFWAFGVLLGIFVGPAQAASRSWLARVAPPAMRNEMFGLLALSGKATAFLGPLLVGWVTWASGSQRLGLATVLLFLAGGLLLMLGVPEADRAVHSAGA
ncbi:MAG TPA: MFS transporter [Gammaproteobacteria bacterium]|nr:MFS transporter [Gammaproteobacteria bacterium]